MAHGIAFEYRIELFTNADALNKLGEDGWDLVCQGGKEGNYLIFKRQVGEAPKTKVPGANADAGMAVKTTKKKSYKDFL